MPKMFVVLIALLLIVLKPSLNAFEKVIIWGHKLHSSTHSYIHDGFYKGFKFLEYDTYWFDNSDNVKNFDFSNCLFITEGQVDDKIPLRKDAVYLVHNVNRNKYDSYENIAFQVYTDDVLSRTFCVKVEPFIYYDFQNKIVYMPWATDLLPSEIERIKSKLSRIKKTKNIYWIGTIGEGVFGNKPQITPFMNACQERGYTFIARNPCGTGVSKKEHIKLIKTSYMAPTIVGEWQKKVGYIPCRIFKNISYGQMGITNSRHVYELFEEKIVYNPDEYQLFLDAQKRLNSLTLSEIEELMDMVKTKHTYINRIHTLLNFLDQLRALNPK